MEGFRIKALNSEKGKLGEDLACKHLKRDKFKIIERNYENPLGEIDIIAKKKDCIHFIEVKYREATRHGHGREAVTSTKQRRIRQSANYWLRKHGLVFKINSCFDIIEIHNIDGVVAIEHLVNCF